MTCYIINLGYDRRIEVKNQADLKNDPAIKPYLDAVQEIAAKYIIGDPAPFLDKGSLIMRRPTLQEIHLVAHSLDDAIRFTEDVLTRKVGPDKLSLADQVTIKEFSF